MRAYIRHSNPEIKYNRPQDPRKNTDVLSETKDYTAPDMRGGTLDSVYVESDANEYAHQSNKRA